LNTLNSTKRTAYSGKPSEADVHKASWTCIANNVWVYSGQEKCRIYDCHYIHNVPCSICGICYSLTVLWSN